jgi:ABC-type enterochelin transport system permease subunit
MTGVEILSSTEVVTAYSHPDAGAITVAVIFGAFFFSSILLWLSSDLDALIVLVGAILGFVFGMIGGYIAENILIKPIEYETHYKVTISDEVSMNEFNEKYEILEQDGKIFTIRERAEQ